MTSPREIELKLEVPQAALVLLTRTPLLRQSRAGSKRPASVVSVYYDTDMQKLRKHGLTLRVRLIGKRHVQTIKRVSGVGSALMDRSEWEQDIQDGRPTFTLVRNTSLKSIFSKKLQAKLKPLFETRVRRKVFPLQSGSSKIELSIDRGMVVAGRRSSPICEVELELKRGDAADLFKVARAFAERVPIRLSVVSKSERGYSLITGYKPSAVGAAPIAISPDASCQTAFQTIARACLHQIVANQELTRTGDPEGLHQTRVGLRRLRASISLFGEMLLGPVSVAIKRDLKWITGELGPARELDVFIKGIGKPPTVRRSQRPGIAPVTRDLLRRKRSEAFARARLAMESRRFRLLVLDLGAWIEAGDWIRTDRNPARANRNLPIAIAATAQMNRRRKKIVKRGKKLDRLDPIALHRIRIQTKKLRYAGEFFGDTFPGKKATRRYKTFIKSLAWLQETLGDLNDISMREGIKEGLADAQPAASGQKRRGSNKTSTSRLSGNEAARIGSILKDAERAYEKFAKAKPFWL